MAKNNKSKKIKSWSEAEIVLKFNLKRIRAYQTDLMKEWLDVEPPQFNEFEQQLFDRKLNEALQKIEGWSEEDLKMKFLAHILELGHLHDQKNVIGFFDKIISAEVEGTFLRVKSDFMLAKGFMNLHQNPYFHSQEYKPNLNPTGEPMAQLLEAFLIGQAKNEKSIPLYGVEIIGERWRFVIMEAKEYCISHSFSAVQENDLLKIIAILRKFKHLLFTRLMD